MYAGGECNNDFQVVERVPHMHILQCLKSKSAHLGIYTDAILCKVMCMIVRKSGQIKEMHGEEYVNHARDDL